MEENTVIRRETPADERAVEKLTRDAFWNVYRPGCVEHYLLHRFRGSERFVPDLNLVLEKDGRIIGHVMYVRSEIVTDAGEVVPVMTFGPFSVTPDEQGKGYGKMLLVHSMMKAAEMGAGALAITGDPVFYGAYGFRAGKDLGICYAADTEADYFLIRELQNGYLAHIKGSFTDPEGYAADDTDVKAFDAGFPFKTKQKHPGQLM